MSIPQKLNGDFFKVWSPKMAYVLGYFAADGTMIRNKRGAHFIEFTSTDRILLEHVKSATDTNCKISLRSNRNGVWKPQYRIQIGSKEWFQDLTQLGFSTNKSKSLKFPSIPMSLVGDFVRGYFDGDGCVYFSNLQYADRKERRWILTSSFSSASIEFLNELHKSLFAAGLKGGSLVSKAAAYELKFSHRDSLALYQLMYNTAQVAPLFLPRKREKFERAIQVLRLDKTLRS